MTHASIQKSNMPSRAAKPYKGMAMEGIIAKWYAGIRRNDDDLDKEVSRVSAKLVPGSDVLEVAPGPGYFSIELAKRGDYHVVGLDISETFVEIAQTNARQAGVAIDFQHGNASEMPFEDGTFDFIVCRAAFKNFTDPVGAIQEMWRVLKPGGTALVIDLRKDVPPEVIARHVRGMKMNPVNAFMTRWTFSNFLIKNAYTTEQLKELVAQTNFKRYDIRLDPMGFELWLEK